MSSLEKTPLSSKKFDNSQNAMVTPPATLSRLKSRCAKKSNLELGPDVSDSGKFSDFANDSDAQPGSLVTPLEETNRRRHMIVDVSLDKTGRQLYTLGKVKAKNAIPVHLGSLNSVECLSSPPTPPFTERSSIDSNDMTRQPETGEAGSWAPEDSPTLHRKITSSCILSDDDDSKKHLDQLSRELSDSLNGPLGTQINCSDSASSMDASDSLNGVIKQEPCSPSLRKNVHHLGLPIDLPANKRRKRISSEKENKPPDEIWSDDVEAAFAEALTIIPKKGLHKIKISGCAKGRNELISDYILAKTGKVRTRKQVSSHIQVIKNLHKNSTLINLILHGPSQTPEIARKFDEIFSRISLAKSLGPLASTGAASEFKILNKHYSRNSTYADSRHSTRSRAGSSKSHPAIDQSMLKRIGISVKRFRFNFLDINDPQRSHNFSVLSNNGAMQPPLRIRFNADLRYRFPRFFELIKEIGEAVPVSINKSGKNKAKPSCQIERASLSVPLVPILHGMVKMTTLPMDEDTTGGEFNAGTVIRLTKLPLSDERFCCLSLVYSFGRLILTTFEKLESKGSRKGDHKDVNCEIRLGTNYWKDFFRGLRKILVKKLTNKTESQLLSRAVKGITMKQVVFSVSEKQYRCISPKQYNLDTIPKDSIRAVLLWEFLRTENPQNAVTTLRLIHLPAAKGNTSSRKALIPKKSVENGVPPLSIPMRKSLNELSADIQGSTFHAIDIPSSAKSAPSLATWKDSATSSLCSPAIHSTEENNLERDIAEHSNFANISIPHVQMQADAPSFMDYGGTVQMPALYLNAQPENPATGDGSFNSTESAAPFSIPGFSLSAAAAEPEEPLETRYLDLSQPLSMSSDSTEVEADCAAAYANEFDESMTSMNSHGPADNFCMMGYELMW
ncbi:DEBR0S5_02476g1_1 [Brettanomyces bruxellensis]|uniref:DEBR0S5_02476g1_1 n=2 Tax=Dekkera bruxellensis TaxID=5007 RepID=A0A7D9H1H4_DEKBR|nr:DEBR0S5_02476g1_1 [Brettanomyces bruxellensis]